MKVVSEPFMVHTEGRKLRKFVNCECPYCGSVKAIREDRLKNPPMSCGCKRGDHIREGRKSHKMSGTKEYRAWSSMISRCTDPGNKAFSNYGGRGITVDPRWLSFDNFFSDVGLAPGKDYSLERKNNNDGYSPGNVIWATQTAQSRNRRTNVVITHLGRSLTIAEWSELTGIPYETLRHRLMLHHWSPDIALTEPVRDVNSPGKPIKIIPRKLNEVNQINRMECPDD